LALLSLHWEIAIVFIIIITEIEPARDRERDWEGDWERDEREQERWERDQKRARETKRQEYFSFIPTRYIHYKQTGQQKKSSASSTISAIPHPPRSPRALVLSSLSLYQPKKSAFLFFWEKFQHFPFLLLPLSTTAAAASKIRRIRREFSLRLDLLIVARKKERARTLCKERKVLLFGSPLEETREREENSRELKAKVLRSRSLESESRREGSLASALFSAPPAPAQASKEEEEEEEEGKN
jgi:hypothetical protein